MLHVVTDSSCDLPKGLVEAHDIHVVPLEVDVDGEIFREGVDITPQEYWERLARAKELPKTSQPSPAAWEETFEALGDHAPPTSSPVESTTSYFESYRLERCLLPR